MLLWRNSRRDIVIGYVEVIWNFIDGAEVDDEIERVRGFVRDFADLACDMIGSLVRCARWSGELNGANHIYLCIVSLADGIVHGGGGSELYFRVL